MSNTPLYIRQRIEQAKRNGSKKLDLSAEYNWNDRFRLNSIPEEVFEIKNLEELDLSRQRLTKLPKELGRLSRLSKLKLYDNKFGKIPEEILLIPQVSVLDLSGNELNYIPAWFSGLTNLAEIDISNNAFKRFPKMLLRLEKLKSLDIDADFDLSDLKKMEFLDELTISSFEKLEIPDVIGELTGLLSLNLFLDDNDTELPKWIGNLKSLRILNATCLKITSIPNWLQNMENLRQLKLSGATKVIIPPWFSNLTQLEKLGLDSFDIQSNPEPLFKLKRLENLSLIDASIQDSLDGIGELTELKNLNLSGTNLRSIPKEILLIQGLESLWLAGNSINKVPLEINKLKNLQSISLHGSNICSLPDSFYELNKLEEIVLSDNLLNDFPSGLCQMQSLVYIDLANNDFEKSKKVKNQISRIPKAVLNLRNLKSLEVYGNPLESLPPEIAKQGWPAVLEYLVQLEKKGKDRLYEAKVLIVGEAGAGKTSLAKKILRPDYKLDNDEISTEGIEVHQFDFQTSDNKRFKTNIWDFGGQEIYHATHQFFLSKRSLYILVADTRKEDTDFYYWMNIVELLSDNSPLVVVKNEKQDRHREINERQLRGRFSNFKETVETNLATNRGLEKVIQVAQHHLTQLPHIGSVLPKTWIEVRKTLEEDKRNYLSLDEYLEICTKHGFEKLNDKLQLSGYLHDLGVCLHFQDDSLLRKTVILNPQWGTNAVYQVLDNQKVIRNLGKFNASDLREIWQDSEYENMHDELLQLMIKFRLCYRIPSQADTYIAPQLLTENQPNYEWVEENNLHLRYQYDFMPKGIINQFIVAIHSMIYQEECVWKSGVVLEKNETFAEVVEDFHNRQIQIRIAGKHHRELLTIVMHEMEKINDSFRRLNYSKYVPCNCMECNANQKPQFYKYEVLQKFIEDEKEIQCQTSYRMIDPNCLLDNIKQSRMVSRNRRQNKVFISYCHEDRSWLEKLQQMLKPLLRKKQFALWADTDIRAGDRWRDEIKYAIESASVAILLVSPGFLASDFIVENELPPILDAAMGEGLRILWIPISFCLYSETAIVDYQAVHQPDQPLDSLSPSELNKVLVQVCKEITQATNNQ